jgi:hypothetical protein
MAQCLGPLRFLVFCSGVSRFSELMKGPIVSAGAK